MRIFLCFLFSLYFTSILQAGVKFHTGHYYQVNGADKTVNSYVMQAAYNEMLSTTAIRGIFLSVGWDELEEGMGNYSKGFALIDGHLAKLKNVGDKKRRLILFLNTKTDNLDQPFIPSYLISSTYQGGYYKWGNSVGGSNPTVAKGRAVKMWVPAIRARLIALMKALGLRYNSDTHFEGVGLNETSYGNAIGFSITDSMVNQIFDNYILVQKEMNLAFPNTMVFQYANYPRDRLPSFISQLKQMGSGLGGPDVWLDDPGVNVTSGTYPGVYSYYTQLSGIVPLTPHIMLGNRKQTCANMSVSVNCKYNPTERSLLNFARDKLKANYLFWTRDSESAGREEVINLLNNLTNTNPNAVKLNDQCPSKHGTCITN